MANEKTNALRILEKNKIEYELSDDRIHLSKISFEIQGYHISDEIFDFIYTNLRNTLGDCSVYDDSNSSLVGNNFSRTRAWNNIFLTYQYIQRPEKWEISFTDKGYNGFWRYQSTSSICLFVFF